MEMKLIWQLPPAASSPVDQKRMPIQPDKPLKLFSDLGGVGMGSPAHIDTSPALPYGHAPIHQVLVYLVVLLA